MLGLSLGVEYISSVLRLTPLDIAGDDLALWLQFNTGITSNESDEVSKWDDQSGNSRHATQGIDANKATESNGALDFEKDNSDHYDLASTITIAENQGFCLAIVMDQETVSNNIILSKDAGDQVGIINTNRFRLKTDVNTTTTTNFHVPGEFDTGKMLILLNRSAGASNRFTMFKNGVQLTFDTDNSLNEAEGENPFGFDINVLGMRGDDAHFFDGKILELAFWERSLTTQEIVDVNYYLKDIHGL